MITLENDIAWNNIKRMVETFNYNVSDKLSKKSVDLYLAFIEKVEKDEKGFDYFSNQFLFYSLSKNEFTFYQKYDDSFTVFKLTRTSFDSLYLKSGKDYYVFKGFIEELMNRMFEQSVNSISCEDTQMNGYIVENTKFIYPKEFYRYPLINTSVVINQGLILYTDTIFNSEDQFNEEFLRTINYLDEITEWSFDDERIDLFLDFILLVPFNSSLKTFKSLLEKIKYYDQKYFSDYDPAEYEDRLILQFVGHILKRDVTDDQIKMMELTLECLGFNIIRSAK